MIVFKLSRVIFIDLFPRLLGLKTVKLIVIVFILFIVLRLIVLLLLLLGKCK